MIQVNTERCSTVVLVDVSAFPPCTAERIPSFIRETRPQRKAKSMIALGISQWFHWLVWAATISGSSRLVLIVARLSLSTASTGPLRGSRPPVSTATWSQDSTSRRWPGSASTEACPAPRPPILCNMPKGQHTATWSSAGFHWSMGASTAPRHWIRFEGRHTAARDDAVDAGGGWIRAYPRGSWPRPTRGCTVPRACCS